MTNDQPAIDDAIEAAKPDPATKPFGGVVYLPPGVYSIEDTILVRSDVILIGAGVGITTIKANFASDDNMISLNAGVASTPVERAAVAEMTIDGGWTADPDPRGHGCGGGYRLVDCHFWNLWIKNVGGYGFGGTEDSLQRCSWHRIKITDVGGDGIDLKNEGSITDGTDVAGNYGNVFDTIWVERHGQSHEELLPPGGGYSEAGLDIRGQALLSNIVVRGFGAEAGETGIRFRPGNETTGNGIGGEKSALTNFYVDGDPQFEATSGIEIHAEKAVNVSNGTIENVGNGVELHAAGTDPSRFHVVSDVHARLCADRGFWVREPASDATLAQCSTNGCPIGFDVEGDRTTLIAPRAHNANTRGIEIRSTAHATDIIRPRYVSNTSNYNDGGTATSVI